MIIGLTGHRPHKLYGYNLETKRYYNLKDRIKEILIENQCEEAITGMALGADIILAYAVLELKLEGYDIKLHCAIPCRNHSCKWNTHDQKVYDKILQIADKVTLVTDEEYRPALMQIRNEFIVDTCDKLIAVWNGSKGGTGNCVNYARRKNKEIIQLEPSQF